LATSFSWDSSKFQSVVVMEKKLERAIFGVCRYWDAPVERYMKHNAPWNDRTTNARNGLEAEAAKLGGGRFAIILRHSVDYGIFLERGTRYMKARPIIEPTIKIYAPKVIKTLTKILDRLGSA
jgi:HK97 gp10 family phage protein